MCPFSVRVYICIARSFSWKLALRFSVLAAAFRMRHVSAFRYPDFPGYQLLRLPQLFQPLVALACSVTPSPYIQYRNLYLLSIGYASRPRLRSRLTQGRSALPWKPWIFGRKDSHLPLATHSGILSSILSTAPFGTASSCIQCSSTNAFAFPSFGSVFQPRTFSAQDLSTSELLRTL